MFSHQLMGKVAAPGSLPSTSLPIRGGALKVKPMVKWKTPSELRGEQLKRENIIELVKESSAPLPDSMNDINKVDNGLKKPDLSRNPIYIDSHMDEVYPVKKSRLRMLSVKENMKENILNVQPNSLKNLSMLPNLAARGHQLSCPENSSAEVSRDGTMQAHQTLERCSQSVFRSVTELSSAGERSSGLAVVDMDKALKGLVAGGSLPSTGVTADSSETFGNDTSTSGNSCPESHVSGQKPPFDFTLKTKMRVVSSCSVSWFHRSTVSSTYLGMPHVMSQFGHSNSTSLGDALTLQILHAKALHSWVYPQFVLPPSIISLGVEEDLLRKRQLMWEDSFRSLYYLLRKKICNIFYVCTPHFVVMFTGSVGSGRTKHICNAYISQSTRSLRSLLREHDVCFCMPLCHSKVEQATTEDLIELSEIEKQNLGQTRRQSLLSEVDNSPQSLLAFHGHKDVHGLYDVLLNYRSLLTFLSGVDVPTLYSPVPFQNAALSAPEVRCVEMKRTGHTPASNDKSVHSSYAGFCSSIEIKDAYLPSWIIFGVCALLSSEEKSFEASFVTESTSIGLNVALGAVCEQSDPHSVAARGLQECTDAFDIPEAILTPCLRSGFLKGLKYNDGSYTASLSPI